MAAMPEIVKIGPSVNLEAAPEQDSLSDEVRAGLRWGDEALMGDTFTRPPRCQAVACCDGFLACRRPPGRVGRLCAVTVRLGRLSREVEVPALDRTSIGQPRLGIERRGLTALRRGSAQKSLLPAIGRWSSLALRSTNHDDVCATARWQRLA
jgi:hypothetical protein